MGHYVALSIVGTDGLPDSGYLRAKVAQEKLITESGLPYSIVRATQFQEFAEAITASLTVGDGSPGAGRADPADRRARRRRRGGARSQPGRR